MMMMITTVNVDLIVLVIISWWY